MGWKRRAPCGRRYDEPKMRKGLVWEAHRCSTAERKGEADNMVPKVGTLGERGGAVCSEFLTFDFRPNIRDANVGDLQSGLEHLIHTVLTCVQ